MYVLYQAEAEVDSLMEQVSQADTKNRSPFKRRAVLSEEEMGKHQQICRRDPHRVCSCNVMVHTMQWRDAAISGSISGINVHRVHAAEMPDFEIPVGEAEYTGDPADKKGQMAHRKQLAQLELQVQCKKVQSLLCLSCTILLLDPAFSTLPALPAPLQRKCCQA